jgi:hypothetical protein
VTWKTLLQVLALAFVVAVYSPAFADDDHGHGHAHDNDKHHAYDADDRDHDFYRDHDRYAMRDWYEDHHDHLPPGFAKRDQLPPGLERQLVVRGTLPPGLQKKMHPCPPDLVRVLPPPPNCEHVLIAGHVVLLNRASLQVVDIFYIEL